MGDIVLEITIFFSNMPFTFRSVLLLAFASMGLIVLLFLIGWIIVLWFFYQIIITAFNNDRGRKKCSECNIPLSGIYWCQPCEQQTFSSWSSRSGNTIIDQTILAS